MMIDDQDVLWPHFAPLWADLKAIAPEILLAGGYALFLKQRWLLSNDAISTIVGVRQWRDRIPRSTRDLDFIAEVSLIASEDRQRDIDSALRRHGFGVVEQNARWQFAKQLGAGRAVVLDFHTPSPSVPVPGVRVESRRVKPQPSLQTMGIHGRENKEAVGSDLHPFRFAWNGLEIAMLNPLTQVIMKLAAMRDRWVLSQDAARPAPERNAQDSEAKKHADDVCRVVAMTTRGEYESARSVALAIRQRFAMEEARAIFGAYLATSQGRAIGFLGRRWHAEHLDVIRRSIAKWLAPVE